MRPRHAAVISLILALAVGAGAYAMQKTTAAAASHATAGAAKDVPAAVASRTRALDRMEAALRRALRKRPPALPKIPHYKPVKLAAPPAAPPAPPAAGVQVAAAPPPAPATPRIVTVRPPPHIVIVHHHGGERDDGEHAGAYASAQGGAHQGQGGGADD